jgi:hypothetical protein
MARYIGLHTLPGFSREMLSAATPALGTLRDAQFLKAYSSFAEGRVVCEFEAPSKESVAAAYATLGFPYDSIIEIDAICDAGPGDVSTVYLHG